GAVHVVRPADGDGGDGRDVADDGAGGVDELARQGPVGDHDDADHPVTPGAGRDGARGWGTRGGPASPPPRSRSSPSGGGRPRRPSRGGGGALLSSPRAGVSLGG